LGQTIRAPGAAAQSSPHASTQRPANAPAKITDEEAADLEEELRIKALKARRAEVISMLQNVRAALVRNDELVGESGGEAKCVAASFFPPEAQPHECDDRPGAPEKGEGYDVHWLTYKPR
jgi:hypothetical protein